MNFRIFFLFYNFAHQSQILDKGIIFFAEFFPTIVMIAALLFLIFHHEVFVGRNPLGELRKKWREISLAFIVSGFAWIFAKALKIFIHSSRPFAEFSSVHPLFSESGFSFPSGHATFFAALAISIFFYHKKTGYFFMLFALIIGIARIMAGVHFPIDILGGFILGGLVAYLVKKI